MPDQKAQRGEVWTFDDFSEGMTLGSVDVMIGGHRISLWQRIYGGGESPNIRKTVPQGLLVTAMMEAYLKIIQPRPPGNIHAGQKLTFSCVDVRPDARLTFHFSCLGKVMKRERRWITLGVEGIENKNSVMQGEIVTIWAK